MGKADFHMHTSLNDGTATVREVLNYVRDRTDLDVVAITDHDRLTGSYEALEIANEYDFDVFAGCEITTACTRCVGTCWKWRRNSSARSKITRRPRLAQPACRRGTICLRRRRG